MMMMMKAMMKKKVMKMIQRPIINMLDLCARDGQRQPLGDLGGYN